MTIFLFSGILHTYGEPCGTARLKFPREGTHWVTYLDDRRSTESDGASGRSLALHVEFTPDNAVHRGVPLPKDVWVRGV